MTLQIQPNLSWTGHLLPLMADLEVHTHVPSFAQLQGSLVITKVRPARSGLQPPQISFQLSGNCKPASGLLFGGASLVNADREGTPVSLKPHLQSQRWVN